jgi:hypothetical protein
MESGWRLGNSASGRYLQFSLSRTLSFATIVAAMLADRRILFDRAVLLPNNLLPRNHLCLDDCLEFVKVPRSKIAGISPPTSIDRDKDRAGKLPCECP